MGEYILRPTQYNYSAGNQYANASYPTENAFDNDINTYWSWHGGFDWEKSRRTFYGFNFNSLPTNEIITEIKIRMTVYSASAGDIVVHPCSKPLLGVSSTGYVEDYPSYRYLNLTTQNTIMTIESTETLPKSIERINADRNAFYGLYLEWNKYGTKRIYDIALVIKTEKMGSLIYNGDKNITSAYLGNTKLNGIYLGSNKLL